MSSMLLRGKEELSTDSAVKLLFSNSQTGSFKSHHYPNESHLYPASLIFIFSFSFFCVTVSLDTGYLINMDNGYARNLLQNRVRAC